MVVDCTLAIFTDMVAAIGIAIVAVIVVTLCWCWYCYENDEPKYYMAEPKYYTAEPKYYMAEPKYIMPESSRQYQTEDECKLDEAAIAAFAKELSCMIIKEKRFIGVLKKGLLNMLKKYF